LIAYFVLGLSLLVGFLLIARWFVSAEPRRVLVMLRWVAAGGGLIIGGYLLWGGRQALAALVVPMMIPALLRWRAVWNRIKAAQGPSPGQSSSIETRFLRMSLDHDSGEMDGMVLEGTFRGRALSELALEDQIALWRECRVADGQSAAVLEAYLDRVHGAPWREAAGAAAAGAGAGAGAEAPGGGAMSRAEALEILGLAEGATAAEIRAAHRRMMQKFHPDHGGSNYLATKINEAKDLLLRG